MSKLRISDAPLLPDVDGTEKIPTGGRGDYTITVDQIKGHIFQDIGKELVGLGNVDNTSDLDKPVSTAQQVALNLKADKTYVDTNLDLKADKTNVYTRSETTLALSKKADLVNGVIPENQIPSSFNDVLEFTTSSLPIVGESGKIYVTTDTNKTWRWGGNKYVEISGWNPDSVSKSVTLPTYYTKEAGVDTVTGVSDGAYFNVRSEDDSFLVEYQNNDGFPAPSGKSYPSTAYVQNIAKYTTLPFVAGKTYGLHDRVQLDNGDTVKSTINGNTNDPNVNMTGWIHEDYGLVKSFNSLAEIEQDPYDGQIIFIKTRDNESDSFFAGHFQFVSDSTETVDDGIVFNAEGGRWIRILQSNVLQAQWFGHPNQIDDQIILNKAIIEADRHLMSLDIRGSVWGINGPVYCIKQMQLLCDWTSYISVNSYGVFPEGWAVMFGDPSVTWTDGRSLITIIGKLRVECGTRVNNLNGVIFKGAWHSVESVRAHNFNGTGVMLDSLHDSAFQDISVELCGNEEDYAFVCSSNDDTSNCLSVSRLQVEQSFQRGIYITKTIRSLFENIHSERLYVTDKTSKPTTVGRDINHVINVDNTQINQALFQSDSDADFFVRMDGVASNFGAIQVHGNLYAEYGGILTYDSCACDSYTQYTAAGSTVFNSLSCENLKLLRDVTINQADVTNFIYGYQCSNITFNGGSVDNVGGGDSSALALGAYVFNNVKIINVYKTGGSADLTHTAFNDCTVTNFYGAYQNNCKVVGGKIKNCDLNTDMYADFTNTQFENFKGNGGIAYTTRNCIATNTATWSTPTLSMLAGTVTERIGYDAAGKIYQNAASGVNWVKIA